MRIFLTSRNDCTAWGRDSQRRTNGDGRDGESCGHTALHGSGAGSPCRMRRSACPPRYPGRATVRSVWMWRRAVRRAIPEKENASANGSTRLAGASSSATQPATAVALWLCVPGLLRVCPFGGMTRIRLIRAYRACPPLASPSVGKPLRWQAPEGGWPSRCETA